MSKEQKESLAAAMLDALKRGDRAALEGCLRLGGDPSVQTSDGFATRPVMHWAARHFKPELAALVIAAGDVNCRDGQGNTALFVAVGYEQPDAVKFFVERGADPLAQNYRNEVALKKAAEIPNETSRARIMQAIVAKPLEEKQPAPEKDTFNAAADKGTTAAIRVLKPLAVHQKGDKAGGGDEADKPAKPTGDGFRL